MPSGGGHVGLSPPLSLSDSRGLRAFCEPNAPTHESGGTVSRPRTAKSAVVRRDDNPMNLEMSLRFVMVGSFCAFPRDIGVPIHEDRKGRVKDDTRKATPWTTPLMAVIVCRIAPADQARVTILSRGPMKG